MSGEKASMMGLLPAVEASGVRDVQCPEGGRRRSNAWEIAPDELCTNDSANESIISGICNMLGEKKKELSSEMEELRIAEKSCRAALAILHREEVAWRSKLDSIKKKLVNASTRKKEASLMLKLHETLEKSGSLSGTVRTVQGILTEDIPVDMKVMVSDCFNEQHTANTKECVVCLSSFTAEDLLSASKSDRCRHTLYPCGHSAVCGMCAKHIWETTRKCPLCRATFTKRPKIFRPGRQQ